MFSEISTIKERGPGLIIINFSIGLGKLYGVFISYLVLEDISSGNWSKLLALSSITWWIVFLGSVMYLVESPRFLIVNYIFNLYYF